MGRGKKVSSVPVETVIDSLAHDGRGVAHVSGKAVFIDGALPGEKVSFQYVSHQRRYAAGKILEVLEASPDRVVPRCAHYSVCGGCSMQHVSSAAQLTAKQQVFLETLKRIGKVFPHEVLPPLQADIWSYRSKARLGVRHVPAKSRVLVGFREKHSNYVADMSSCEVLDARVGHRLAELSVLIGELSIKDYVPQIEVAIGDQAVCLVFRILNRLNADDIQKLEAFGRQYDFQILIQTGGPDSIQPIGSFTDSLFYFIENGSVRLGFSPLDFTQVNQSLNRLMVSLAMDLLAPEADESVLDLFCGLGNFSLPLAKRAAHVVGVEGDIRMTAQALRNAKDNTLDNVEFFACDLFGEVGTEVWMQRHYDKVLLDPPRAGAEAMMQPIAEQIRPEKILYISCNAGTLARDAGMLVNQYGYHLCKAGIMDMFPHTAHSECIALFQTESA